MARRDDVDTALPIRFGAGGWRGLLAEDFTLPRVRAVVEAVADSLQRGVGAPPVLVAHDHRFLGDRFAAAAREVLAERGIPVLWPRAPLATPVAAHAVRSRRAALGLVFTASHNPAEYQGLKLIAASGGALPEADLRRIEGAVGRPRRGAVGAPGRVRRIDGLGAYLRDWARHIDVRAIGRGRPRIWFDAMHGSGAGVLDRALLDAGARVVVLRGDPDPRFGGSPPDPRPERLAALRRALGTGRGPRLGLATDGDADRFAVVDAGGRVLSESEVAALIVDHLARTGRIRRGVALSIATGGLAERVARAHGLAVERHPLGFSPLAHALEAGRVDLAADESGGVAFRSLGPGKDGVWAGGLLAEIVAETRAPLARRLVDLERRHGRSCCARSAVPATPGSLERFEALCDAAPARVAGERVHHETGVDGLRLLFHDGFLMLRASSTEPVLRVYAEASGPLRVRRRLAIGRSLLED